jgi:hypothetical protein
MDSDEYDVRRGADGWRGANASVAGKACDNNTVRTNTDMGRTGLIRTQQLMFASPVAQWLSMLCVPVIYGRVHARSAFGGRAKQAAAPLLGKSCD